MKRIILVLLILAGIAAFSSAQTSGAEVFRQEGIASWYGPGFEGRPTASGEIFNSSQFTAAHQTLPFGTVLLVTNLQNKRQVVVRINDRGPFVAARIIDLSKAAAEVVDMTISGTAPVVIEQVFNLALGPVANPVPVAAPASLPNPVPVAAPALPPSPVPVASPSPPPNLEPTPATAPNVVYVVETSPESTPVSGQTPAPARPQAAQQTYFPAPAAVIRGGIPPADSNSLYRLQVGAFSVPRNAVDAFEKLKGLGLNPNYEQNGEFYRVVLTGLRAAEIPSVAQTLGNAGFREAIIREETN
jgi:rare lipoprotein A